MDAGIAALLGAGVGIVGALIVSATERTDAARGERRRAYSVYLGALYPLVAELRDMPPARPPGAATRLIDRLRGPEAQWLVTQKAIVDVGNRPRTLGDRLSAALAYVQVLDMPDEVTQAIAEANDYVDRLSKHRSEALKAEWPDILARLQTAKTALQPRWPPERRRAKRARQPEDLQR